MIVVARFSSTGFSLWVFVLACTKPHRLKPVLLFATASFAYTAEL